MLPPMKQTHLRTSIFVALLFAVTGCAAAPMRADNEWAEASVAMAPPDSGGERMMAMAPPKPAPEPLPTDGNVDKPAGTPAEAARRLVIYTGSVSSLVAQVEPALAAFVAKVGADGGYLQNRSGTSVTVRVPAAQFFNTLQWLRENGQVSDEQINAIDVTKQVFDIELRMKTADEARKRLLKLLETATKMEDILAIETQLRRLTDEIESMKGDLRNLSDQIAFSTLTVNFYANAPAPNPYPQRTRSRFEWINQVGIENVMGSF
jgi:hypothetical protein